MYFSHVWWLGPYYPFDILGSKLRIHSTKMFTALQLTKLVAESKACSQINYKSPSDHKSHAQRVKVSNGNEEFEIVVATFNVLNPKYVLYQSGIPPKGKELPSWINMETQAGLEQAPASDPKRQAERVSIIFEGILTLFRQHQKVVLCIQECWPELAARLFLQKKNYGFEFAQNVSLKTNNFCLTIISSSLEYEFENEMVILKTPGIAVANVHLGFSTKENMLKISDLISRNVMPYLFVVGDFNIQTRPLSKEIGQEGVCTAILEQIAKAIQVVDGCTPLFGAHADGWTNWNVRKNCLEPEKNWDHFDNIMLLSKNPKNVTMFFEDWNVIYN